MELSCILYHIECLRLNISRRVVNTHVLHCESFGRWKEWRPKQLHFVELYTAFSTPFEETGSLENRFRSARHSLIVDHVHVA